MDNRSL
jgi:hypothetical protein